MKGHRWIAAVYDLMSQGDERVLGPIRQRLLSDLRGPVLEIGAGTGFSTEEVNHERLAGVLPLGSGVARVPVPASGPQGA